MQDAVGELRHLGKFRLPGHGEGGTIGLDPMGFAHRPNRNVHRLHGPDQPHAPFDLAIVEHDARRRHLHGGAARTLVDEEPGAAVIEMAERRVQRERTVAFALGDGQ